MSKSSMPEDLRDEYFNDPDFRRKLAKRRKFFNRGSNTLIWGAIILSILFVVYAVYLFRTLPSLEQLENPKPQLATEVYSSDGVLLTKFFIKNRTFVHFQDIAPTVVESLVATEDVGFYSHWGFDMKRFFKAMIENVVKLRTRWYGASTITQQLAKNLYLTPERSISRKIRELLTAIQIERSYTKKEILSLYLNTVYFGQGAYGVESASWTYFSKPAKELTVAEGATLVALLKSPYKYNPVAKPDDAIQRRNLILELMNREKMISEVEMKKWKNVPLNLHFTPVTDNGIAPYFTEYVRQRVQAEAEKRKLNIYEDGLIIQTTIDSRMQRYAEIAVQKQVNLLQSEFNKSFSWTNKDNLTLRDSIIAGSSYFKEKVKTIPKAKLMKSIVSTKKLLDSLLRDHLMVQSAFIAIEPQTGHIKAWVGGIDFQKYKFDRVWQAKRQPGSTFKPFVYLTALGQGIAPTFTILNQPLAIQTEQKMWVPKNSDEGDAGGETSLRDALKRSLNYVTIRLALNHAQPSKIEKTAIDAGITSKLTVDLSMALGSSIVTPLELAGAYSTLANYGMRIKPISILKIQDKFENEIASFTTQKEQTIDAATDFVLVSMLRSVIDEGTGSSIRSRYKFFIDAAGKTGTTQGQADAWFSGFTPQLQATVWTGFDDPRIKFTSMKYGQGSRAALPIWAEFMNSCYKDSSLGLRPMYFQMPKGVQKIYVSSKTKKPTLPGLEDGYYEYFTDAMIEKDPELKEYLEKLNTSTSNEGIPRIQVPTNNAPRKKEGEF